MSKRKTVQVSQRVHERLDKMFHKVYLGFDYDRSSSGVIEYLMDFYEKNRSPEMELALSLIKTVEERLQPKQLDILEAIKKAQQMDREVKG